MLLQEQIRSDRAFPHPLVANYIPCMHLSPNIFDAFWCIFDAIKEQFSSINIMCCFRNKSDLIEPSLVRQLHTMHTLISKMLTLFFLLRSMDNLHRWPITCPAYTYRDHFFDATNFFSALIKEEFSSITSRAASGTNHIWSGVHWWPSTSCCILELFLALQILFFCK